MGRVAPANGYVAISAGVSGIIASINFDIGSHVHQGDELLRIRCNELEAASRAAEARGAAALAVATRVRNGSRAEEIKVAEANVGFAMAKSDEADSAFKRAQTLSEGNSISKAVYLQAQRDARLAAAQLKKPVRNLRCCAPDRVRKTSRQKTRGRKLPLPMPIWPARNSTSASSERLWTAPLSHVSFLRGQYVSTALSQTLLRLADDRELIVRAQIEAPHVMDLCPNQTGTIIVGASRKQFTRPRSNPSGRRPTQAECPQCFERKPACPRICSAHLSRCILAPAALEEPLGQAPRQYPQPVRWSGNTDDPATHLILARLLAVAARIPTIPPLHTVRHAPKCRAYR